LSEPDQADDRGNGYGEAEEIDQGIAHL
jgi:hypothetical protein